MLALLLASVITLVSPENGAMYDTHSPCVRKFLDNPELRSEYPSEEIIAAEDSDGNHYVANAWMKGLLAETAQESYRLFSWTFDSAHLTDIALEFSEDDTFANSLVERYVKDDGTSARPLFLKLGTDYWWRVKGRDENGAELVSDVRTFHTADTAPRILGLPGFNCRDLGGGVNADGVPVRQGLVIRGQAPPARKNAEYSASSELPDEAYYRSLFIDKLGIRTDLDFRSESEFSERCEKYGEIDTARLGINHVFHSFTPYHINIADNITEIRQIFRMFKDPANFPIYFHCAVGSDRTGTIGILLDGLLGRTDEHIYNDYELPTFNSGLARLRYCRKGAGLFSDLTPTNPDRHIRDSVVEYFLRIGFTRDELKAIRRNFLETDGPDDFIDNFPLAQVVYEKTARRLTFYYDAADHTGDDTLVYSTASGSRSWGSGPATNALEVVFDASFADFRPTTCHQWFENFNKVTNMTNLANLDTSLVTNMGNMFRDCFALKSPDFSHFDTSNVGNMQQMFRSCKAFTTLDLYTFATPMLTNISMMFYECSSMTTIYVSRAFVTDKVTDGTNAFRKSRKLVGGNGTACDGDTNLGVEFARPDEPGSPGYFTLSPADRLGVEVIVR